MENNSQERAAENLAKLVGSRLRRIRQEKSISLQKFADITGVSKLTLGNIERGEGNPSLAIIWKIANGLSIPISTLLHETEKVSISRKHEGNKVISANDACTLEPMFEISHHGTTEIHRAFLQPYSTYKPGAHQAGVDEYVTVMKGKLEIIIGDNFYQLDEFDSIRFSGDVEHAYINPTDSETVLHFVMTYAQA